MDPHRAGGARARSPAAGGGRGGAAHRQRDGRLPVVLLRLVLLTNSSPHGQRIVLALAARGVRLDAVLVLTPPLAHAGEAAARRLAALPLRAARWARRMAGYLLRERPAYRRHADQVRLTGSLNGARLLRDLRAAAPDVLLLGGGGIVSAEVIATARVGVLNAHPALLPWLRGNGVVGHGLEAGIPPGATVHWVDPGIDTGPIVARRLLPQTAAAVSLDQLWIDSFRLAAEMMAETAQALKEGRVPPAVAQQERHPLYRNDPARDAEHERLARSGRAAELFRRWAPLCVDERGNLPAGPIEPPPACSSF